MKKNKTALQICWRYIIAKDAQNVKVIFDVIDDKNGVDSMGKL